MKRKQILKIKRITLLVFIFSLPFEYWDPFGIASFFSITKMAGFGYAALALLIGKESFDVSIFKFVRLLLLLWVLMLILNMLNYIGTNTVNIFNFTFFQNILLYWLIASDLKKQYVHIKSLMLSFVLSIVLMSILLMFGIGLGQEFEEGVSRITFFENNPNTVGVLAGLAIVFSLYFILNPIQTFQKKGALVLLALPGFVNLLLLSGSRGALLTTALSVIIMMVMNKSTPFKRLLQIGLLIVASSYFLDKLMESELMYKRITQSIEEGNTAGRGEIWEDVVEIWSNKPFLGHGATGFETEMTILYGGRKDAHNLFLYILVTTGFVGISIFLYFLFFHIKKALQKLKQGDILKIIILVFYLTTVVKSGGVINNKLMWLLLAIIISAELYNKNQFKNENSLRNR